MAIGADSLDLDSRTTDPAPAPGLVWYRSDLDRVCFYDSASSVRSFKTRNRYHQRLDGRFYLYPDQRWVTPFDDNYGVNLQNWQESGGTAADPVPEWEHGGMLVPPGTRITHIDVMGRVNNVEIADMELYFAKISPSTSDRWEGVGVDNDAEVVTDVIHRDNFFAPTGGGTPFTGAINDRHLRRIPVSGPATEFAEFGEFRMYLRPTSVPTANRFFLATVLVQMEDI